MARRRTSRIYGARLRPGSRPFDLFDPARKGRNKLYVRRVLITEDADLLPGWLRFVRLVVDSADLPLNVSRELIQKSHVFAAIRKGVTNRVVQELGKLAEPSRRNSPRSGSISARSSRKACTRIPSAATAC